MVQVTRDGIPVIYPHWFLPNEDFPVTVGSVTLAQAKTIFNKARSDAQKRIFEESGLENLSTQQVAILLYESFVTLEDLLQV